MPTDPKALAAAVRAEAVADQKIVENLKELNADTSFIEKRIADLNEAADLLDSLPKRGGW